jgi:hypothetical protein
VRAYSIADENGCWIWQAGRTGSGYGMLRDPSVNSMRGAHRMAYRALVGPIPEGLEIDHLCRVRACVNPAHLEPVTHAENQRRRRRPKSPGRAAAARAWGRANGFAVGLRGVVRAEILAAYDAAHGIERVA